MKTTYGDVIFYSLPWSAEENRGNLQRYIKTGKYTVRRNERKFIAFILVIKYDKYAQRVREQIRKTKKCNKYSVHRAENFRSPCVVDT